jgi:[ribosomal protein S18]-alanine N-acetyltransferase
MNHRVRRARHADLGRLALLHARCFPADAWDAVALAGIIAMSHASGHFVADEDGTPTGLIFDSIVAGEAEVLTLGVDPAQRRRGIARALLADFLVRARTAGAARVLLEVAADNEPALALYRSLGFERVGTRPGYYAKPSGSTRDAWLLRRVLDR